ncbi:MAG TPA: hypothetical protein VGE74_17870 [Gemmata sp.]
MIRAILITTTLVFATVAGGFLLALYASAADSGGTVVAVVQRSFATGDWSWVTGTVALGWALIAGSAVGFLLLAAAIVRRARDKAKDARGFQAGEVK